MMSLTFIAGRWTGLLTALVVAAGVTTSPVMAAPLPGGASSLVETFQDWVVACQAQETTTTCLLRQVQTNTQNSQTVLTVELRNAGGGRLDGALLMPFGLALAKGVTLKIDDAAAGALSFSTCVPQGCLVPISLDVALVTKMKSGTALNISAAALNPAQPVALKVSLKGFPAALNRVIELTK